MAKIIKTTLEKKSDIGHKHNISDVNNLQSSLDSKQAKGNYMTFDPEYLADFAQDCIVVSSANGSNELIGTNLKITDVAVQADLIKIFDTSSINVAGGSLPAAIVTRIKKNPQAYVLLRNNRAYHFSFKSTDGLNYSADDIDNDDGSLNDFEIFINTTTNAVKFYSSSIIPLDNSLLGKANGIASLDASGKVPTAFLPSYVDDVLEYANKAAFPTTGEAGKIYIDKATNKTYRWGGSGYVEISQSLALGETSSTAYAGDKGKANRDDINTLKATTVKTTGDQNVAGTKTFDNYGAVQVQHSADESYCPAIYVNQYGSAVAANPFKDLWHDKFAFLRGITVENHQELIDGTWTDSTFNLKVLFASKDAGSHLVLSKNAKARRFDLISNNFNFSGIKRIQLGISYSDPFSTFQILIAARNATDNTWFAVHTSDVTVHSNFVWLKLVDYADQNVNGFRIQIVKLTNSSTGEVRFTSIRGLTDRPSDQGEGKEYEMPFEWDENGAMNHTSKVITLANSTDFVQGQVQISNYNNRMSLNLGNSGILNIAKMGINGLNLNINDVTSVKELKVQNKSGTIALTEDLANITNNINLAITCDHEYEITGQTNHEYGVAIPDTTQVRLKKIKGQSGRVSENLFYDQWGDQSYNGITKISDGYKVKFSGTATATTPFFLRSVKDAGTYTFYYEGLYPINVEKKKQDGTYEYLGLQPKTPYVFTNDSAYAQHSFYKQIDAGTTIDNTYNLMIVKGSYINASELPPFKPYDNTLVNANCNFLSTGKNLFNKYTITKGKALGNDGGTYNDPNLFVSDYILVVSNATLKRELKNGWARFYDERKNYLADAGGSVSGAVPFNARYIRCTSAIGDEDNCFITYDTTMTASEPYQESRTELGIELGEWDYIDTESNVVVRQTSEKITLNGSENWRQEQGRTEDILLFKVDGLVESVETMGYTYKHSVNNVLSDETCDDIWYGSYDNALGVGKQLIQVRKSDITTVADFQTWLASNPITLVYKLKEPTIEPLVVPNGYEVHNGGLQVQETDNSLPYILEKEYAISTSAQIQTNIQIDQEQQEQLDGKVSKSDIQTGELGTVYTDTKVPSVAAVKKAIDFANIRIDNLNSDVTTLRNDFSGVSATISFTGTIAVGSVATLTQEDADNILWGATDFYTSQIIDPTNNNVYFYLNNYEERAPIILYSNSSGVMAVLEVNTSTKKATVIRILQDKLVSGTNIKTVNGQSLLGSGNINITGGGIHTVETFVDGGTTTETVETSGYSMITLSGQLMGVANDDVTLTIKTSTGATAFSTQSRDGDYIPWQLTYNTLAGIATFVSSNSSYTSIKKISTAYLEFELTQTGTDSSISSTIEGVLM